MKSVRLLPVVIFAAAALLIFKGVGLVTNGGYVLVGTSQAVAAGGSSGPPTQGKGSGTTEGVVDDGFTSLIDPTMTDTAPTADDAAPTLPLGDGTADGRAAAAAAGGELAAQAVEVPVGSAPAVPPAACPPEAVPCLPEAPMVDGVAQPVVQDGSGQIVPFATDDSSASAVEERLGERRVDLDAREQELEMRLALVEAAEKRINERTAVLQQLEARIDALVDQNREAEEGQFKSIVSLYETMKPKEAAVIFDELDMNTLLRVSRAMSPRKLAPIMARMSPIKARDLTASMAVAPTEATVAVTAEDLAALPQIIGQ